MAVRYRNAQVTRILMHIHHLLYNGIDRCTHLLAENPTIVADLYSLLARLEFEMGANVPEPYLTANAKLRVESGAESIALDVRANGEIEVSFRTEDLPVHGHHAAFLLLHILPGRRLLFVGDIDALGEFCEVWESLWRPGCHVRLGVKRLSELPRQQAQGLQRA